MEALGDSQDRMDPELVCRSVPPSPRNSAAHEPKRHLQLVDKVREWLFVACSS